MFTVMLWDQAKHIALSQVENMQGNETFLMQSDADQYPLLADLADCAEDIHCGDSLPKLLIELQKMREQLELERDIAYANRVIELTKLAIQKNKCILFTPFVT